MSQLPTPVSSRQAFASAIGLALRRDPLQSLVVPFLLRAPWAVAATMIFTPGEGPPPGGIGIWWLATLGGALVGYITDAMLMLRARSTLEGAPGGAPAPAIECYSRGLARVPWLIVTDVVRAVLMLAGFVFFIVPGFFVVFRLAFATQAVVLSGDSLASGFGRSSRLTARRLDRWLEMAGLTLLFVLAPWAVYLAAVSLHLSGAASFAAIPVVMVAMEPVLVYAWTFFCLRLMALDAPGIEVSPLYAVTPLADQPSSPLLHPMVTEPEPEPPLPPPPAPPAPLA